MLKILIADDHFVVRRGLKQIFSESLSQIEIEEAENGNQLISKLREDKYNLVIMDISMPGQNGLEILKNIKIEFPKIPVLILSMYSEEKYGIRMMKAGASGYLNKESAPEELLKAADILINGGKYFSPALMNQLILQLDSKGEQIHTKLSDREFQVMLLIATGKQIKEIAEELSLSVPSISTYRSRVLHKMNFSNNADITYYAIKNNLID